METPEINQPQTPQIQIKKQVKEALVLKVEKSTYNIIRSFVESSAKQEYVWNTGIKVGDKTVFIKPGKWVLEVYADRVVLVGRNIEMEIDQKQLRIGNLVFDLQKLKENAIEAMSTFIVADVPFSRPISLNEILEKVREYVEI